MIVVTPSIQSRPLIRSVRAASIRSKSSLLLIPEKEKREKFGAKKLSRKGFGSVGIARMLNLDIFSRKTHRNVRGNINKLKRAKAFFFFDI